MSNNTMDLRLVESELVPVYEDANRRHLVNARELHEFLDSQWKFPVWIHDRLYKYGFVEGEDFIRVPAKGAEGKSEPEFILLLDTSKEIAMMENNEKGRQVRRYFMDVEKRSRDGKVIPIPRSLSEALYLAAKLEEERERLELENRTLRHKAEFYDAVAGSRTAISIGTVAKILNFKNVGRNTLFAFLRKQRVLLDNNTPHQEYIDRGYFRVIEQKYQVDGEPHISLKTVVYQRGVDFIRKKLLAAGYKPREESRSLMRVV